LLDDASKYSNKLSTYHTSQHSTSTSPTPTYQRGAPIFDHDGKDFDSTYSNEPTHTIPSSTHAHHGALGLLRDAVAGTRSGHKSNANSTVNTIHHQNPIATHQIPPSTSTSNAFGDSLYCAPNFNPVTPSPFSHRPQEPSRVRSQVRSAFFLFT
jgi:hypothetical protein